MDAGLDQLNEGPTVRNDILVLACPPSISERLAVAAVAVMRERGHPPPNAKRIALTPRRRTRQHFVGDRLHPGLIAAPCCQHQPRVVERRDPGRVRNRGDLVDQSGGVVDGPGMDIERGEEIGHAR